MGCMTILPIISGLLSIVALGFIVASWRAMRASEAAGRKLDEALTRLEELRRA